MYCTVKNITDLLEGVDEYDPLVWTDAAVASLADDIAQPYFEEVLCGGRSFGNAEYTEHLDGTGDCYLRLSNYPITTVSALTIDGVVVDLTDPAEEVFIYKTRIARKTNFPSGMQNVVITYEAGYDTIPKSVASAIALLCAMHISRVCGSGGGAIASGISAGPIALREAFSAAGKYSDKISDWNKIVLKTARIYNGTKPIGQPRKNQPGKYYEPRTDRWL
jgi:hypothetical protein